MKKETRKSKVISDYAHDYRNVPLGEQDLTEMLQSFLEVFLCEHECTSRCRREGCNCSCGERHTFD